MEKISEYQRSLAEAVAVINGENLTALNFDSLKQMLTDIGSLLEEFRQDRASLAMLREDYKARISGMEKAIAISNRNREGMERTLELIDSLGGLSAAELIRQYTKTQARFKDAFPTSFGFLHSGQPAQSRRNLSDYK